MANEKESPRSNAGRAAVTGRVRAAITERAQELGIGISVLASRIVDEATDAILDGYDLEEIKAEMAIYDSREAKKLHNLPMSREDPSRVGRTEMAAYLVGQRPTTYRALVSSIIADPEWWLQAAKNLTAAVEAVVRAFAEQGEDVPRPSEIGRRGGGKKKVGR